MCKEKTNKSKLALAEKKIVDEEIREAIRENDNYRLRIVVEKIKNQFN